MNSQALHALTVKALRLQAAELQIRGRSRMRKRELVAAILAAQPAPESLAEPTTQPAPTRRAIPPRSAPSSAGSLSRATESAPGSAAALAPAVDALEAAPAEAAPEVPAAPPTEADVYIDRGRPLPASYPDHLTRVMVKDPGTAYLYWENGARDWRAAIPEAQPVAPLPTGPRGGGYLRVPSRAIEQPHPVTEPAPGPAGSDERWVQPAQDTSATADGWSMSEAPPPWSPDRPAPSLAAPERSPSGDPRSDDASPFTPYTAPDA